jgi:crossover junction endodeoxyribonuclease RuvC
METIILGIDPGTLVMGYGLVAAQGKTARLLTMDVLKMSPKMDSHERLHLVHQKVTLLIQTHKPTAFAIEAPFFGKNVQSMLKLGRAQGVAIAAAMNAGLTVREYSPKTIKQVITGKGNADKEQVWKMLQHILGFEAKPEYLDATDGLAVALCHFYQANSIEGTTGGRRAAQRGKAGWAAFIEQHPHRLR